jgi:hypothetical protein
MLYIHQNTCISPQQTFLNADINFLIESIDSKLTINEPGYEGIPPTILRRMGKAVRMGVGAALPLIQQTSVAGIIIGTANGGVEDCIKFLDQIIQYEEGMLTPGNFVQSTSNGIAAQVGLLTRNKGYNITHVHRGLAFENALLDAAMITKEHPEKNYLLGALDEISAYNYNIDYLAGWFKTKKFSSRDLFTIDSAGSLAGEGAAMFIVNNSKMSAEAYVQDVATLHSENEEAVTARLKYFLDKNLKDGEKIDLLISGENGDNRLMKFYIACESLMGDDTMVARFKHMSGEFGTASVIAFWLGCYILKEQEIAAHMIKKNFLKMELKKILIYNNHKGSQHSFILLSKP